MKLAALGKAVGLTLVVLICIFWLASMTFREPMRISSGTQIRFLKMRSWGFYSDETLGCGPTISVRVKSCIYGPIAVEWVKVVTW